MRTFSTDDLNRIWHDILFAPITDKLSVSVINTDSRTIGAGETFVVVSGENFDAHQFIPMAIERGASAVVVEKKQDNIAVPQIVVSNTRLALAQLATVIREEFTGTVIGLTGSVGKTTNKQMLASIFAQVGNTHATKGNLNNDLGVPFTWFALPENTDYAVIEMGANHQGEIAYLANITRPNIAMITNAGQAHLEGFGGLDGVAKGKGELFEILSAGDTAIINYDDTYYQYWRELLADGVSVLTFSLENNQADVYAKNISADGSHFTLCYTEKYQRGGITIIDDTYNANPMSMRASADILANTNGYRIMVVGDMGELGSDEIALHAQLGKDLLGKADAFFCLGEKMRAFAENNETAQHFSELSVLCQTLADNLLNKPSVTVLVKGSRSMKMERVVEYLLGAN